MSWGAQRDSYGGQGTCRFTVTAAPIANIWKAGPFLLVGAASTIGNIWVTGDGLCSMEKKEREPIRCQAALSHSTNDRSMTYHLRNPTRRRCAEVRPRLFRDESTPYVSNC